MVKQGPGPKTNLDGAGESELGLADKEGVQDHTTPKYS